MRIIICQRCGEREEHWNVAEAEFHVRAINRWKVQLCERCAVRIEMLLHEWLTRMPEGYPTSHATSTEEQKLCGVSHVSFYPGQPRHRVMNCTKPLGHEGDHVATVGAIQR